jgi:hypothetical protein
MSRKHAWTAWAIVGLMWGCSSSSNTTTTAGGGGPGGGATGGSTPQGDAGFVACSGETPAGTAACGAGKSCHLASCGPPAQYACVAAGSGSAGTACMTNADCASGLNCIGYSSTLRTCEKQCTDSSECGGTLCADYSACNEAVRGKFCLRACTDFMPAGAAACGMGFKCDTAACIGTFCIAAGTAKSGSCMGSSDCAAGYICVNVSSDGGGPTCTQLCQTNSDCTTGSCIGNSDCSNGPPTNIKFCL